MMEADFGQYIEHQPDLTPLQALELGQKRLARDLGQVLEATDAAIERGDEPFADQIWESFADRIKSGFDPYESLALVKVIKFDLPKRIKEINALEEQS